MKTITIADDVYNEIKDYFEKELSSAIDILSHSKEMFNYYKNIDDFKK